MAVTIDASSPAATSTTAQVNTTGSFTPPDTSLLLALWAGNTDGTGVDPPDPSIAASPAQTFGLDVWERLTSGSPTVEGQAAIWHSVLDTSPGASTVSVTNGEATSQARGSILRVLVITDHAPNNPVGVCGGGRQSSGTSLSQSYTASITGGQGFMVVSDWAAASTAAWAAATGCTILSKGTIGTEVSYAVLQRTTADGVISTTTTLGLTGLTTGGSYHWAYAEVISYEAFAASQDPEWVFGQVVQVI